MIIVHDDSSHTNYDHCDQNRSKTRGQASGSLGSSPVRCFLSPETACQTSTAHRWHQDDCSDQWRSTGILIPLIFFETCWWCQASDHTCDCGEKMLLVAMLVLLQAIKHDYFSYFPDRYLLSITMIFGDSSFPTFIANALKVCKYSNSLAICKIVYKDQSEPTKIPRPCRHEDQHD